MAFDPDRVSTITFDSYSTIVDVDAVEAALAAHVDDPEPVSRLWRARSLEYTFVANHTDAYQPFYAMNRDALEHALAAHGVDLAEDEREAILETYHDLDVFGDVRDGIERLREGGYDCYVVSNGNPEMLASMVEGADIDDLVVDTISAEEVETFKPEPEIYRHAAARTGTPIDRSVHTAGPSFDVLGAMSAGAQGAWLDREGDPWESFAGRDPDVTVESFHDLAEALGV